jgi:hydroxymethylbilane synthase
VIRLGTRGSRLALAQAQLVAQALGGADIVVVRTAGDDTTRPLADLGDGAFTTAIETALRDRSIDAAAHSLKDLPTEERTDLVVAAVPRREDPRDVLITRERGGLATLQHGAIVGTSSPRRGAFLQLLRPDVIVKPIRGNVDTRLEKVARGEYDAIVLAIAGLRRLGVAVADAEILELSQLLPAPGQGAIALQCRADDAATRAVLVSLDDPLAHAATDAERALLRLLGGSCELALGAHAIADAHGVALEAALMTESGPRRARARGTDALSAARAVAAGLGGELGA